MHSHLKRIVNTHLIPNDHRLLLQPITPMSNSHQRDKRAIGPASDGCFGVCTFLGFSEARGTAADFLLVETSSVFTFRGVTRSLRLPCLFF